MPRFHRAAIMSNRHSLYHDTGLRHARSSWPLRPFNAIDDAENGNDNGRAHVLENISSEVDIVDPSAFRNTFHIADYYE